MANRIHPDPFLSPDSRAAPPTKDSAVPDVSRTHQRAWATSADGLGEASNRPPLKDASRNSSKDTTSVAGKGTSTEAGDPGRRPGSPEQLLRLGALNPHWRAQTDKILQQSPEWLTPDLVKKTDLRLKSTTWAKRVATLRGQLSVMQTEQDTWNLLIEALSNPKEANEPLKDSDLSEYVTEHYQGELPATVVELKMFETLKRRQRKYIQKFGEGAEVAAVIVPGPVGDAPLHQCFLLGMVELGKKVVDTFYFNHELLNVPYSSDLKAWRDAGVMKKEEDDGGLYTGQTVLHIAVNLKDLDLISWLLERGANIVARARGAFFGPPRIRIKMGQDERGMRMSAAGHMPLYKGNNRSVWKRLMGWLQGIDPDFESVARFRSNDNSACYYGEFPLSFAASLGEPAACDLLCKEFKRRREAKDKSLCEFFEQAATRRSPEGELMSKALEHIKLGDMHPAWSPTFEFDYFSNAQDSHGNTALHLAVLHAKKDAIQWLCTQGGASPSLAILNEDGFTPLTLAARNRNPKIFNFLLRQIRLIAWTYGGVKMIKTPLDQIDTFRIHGHPLHKMRRWRSALEIIVQMEVEEFAHDEMINNLIMDKWNRFGFKVYLSDFLLTYAACIVVLTITLYLRTDVNREEVHNLQTGHFLERGDWSYARWFAYMWQYGSVTQNRRMAASVFEIVLVVLGMPRLVRHGWQSRRLRREDLDPHMEGKITITKFIKFVQKNLLFILLLACAACSVVAVVAGLIHKTPCNFIEMQALAFLVMLMWSGLLLCILPFKFFGVLVITIWQMLTDGIFKFLVTYLILVAGFSQSLFALFQLSDDAEGMSKLDTDPGRLFFKLIWVSVGDTRFMEEAIAASATPEVSLVFFIVYLVLVMVLMLNLLIAMMGKAFNTYMKNSHKTWFFPFAHLVFRMERLLPPDQLVYFRAGRPGNVMDPTTEGFRSATFYDIRIDKEETLRRNAKHLRAQKNEKVVLQTIKHSVIDPFEQCHESLDGIAAAFRRLREGPA